jgi:hypothetical protein
MVRLCNIGTSPTAQADCSISDYVRGALYGLWAVCIWAAFIVISRFGVRHIYLKLRPMISAGRKEVHTRSNTREHVLLDISKDLRRCRVRLGLPSKRRSAAIHSSICLS